jgi:hypothetical protein
VIDPPVLYYSNLSNFHQASKYGYPTSHQVFTLIIMSRITLQVPQFGDSKCDPREDPDQAPFQREAIKILEQYLQPDGQLMLRDATKQLLTLLTHPDRQIMRERVNGLTNQSRWATTYDLDHPLHAEQPLVQRLIEANLNHDAFSNLVVEAARRIPFDHPAQVKLVRLVSLMTPRADSAGCLSPMKRSEQPYWQTDHIMERAEDDRICESLFLFYEKTRS